MSVEGNDSKTFWSQYSFVLLKSLRMPKSYKLCGLHLLTITVLLFKLNLKINIIVIEIIFLLKKIPNKRLMRGITLLYIFGLMSGLIKDRFSHLLLYLVCDVLFWLSYMKKILGSH